MKEQLTFTILENEYWWGGAANHGAEMPIGRESRIFLDLQECREGDQYASLFLSSRGRYLWSEKAFTFCAEKGRVVCQGTAPISLYEGYDHLKGAYLTAIRRHFPAHCEMVDPRFFSQPQYNTWIEMETEQTTRNILRYARGILRSGMPPGVLMIDGGWQEDFGVFEFHRRKIPNPRRLVDQLHALGFSVMLWVSPIVACAGPRFKELRDRGFLLRDQHGEIACREWWDGISAVLDLSNPQAVAWYHEQLHSLMARYGVDGFKFDAGDRYFYRDDDQTFAPTGAREQTSLYNRIGESYGFNEFRAAWNYGRRPIVARLQDKKHSWDQCGINCLIPNTVMQGLLGYVFCCPDMVGGGEIGSFATQKKLDEELFVRWAQANALMGMMQISLAPWRVLSRKNAELVKQAMRLHMSMGEKICSLARHAAATGEPIVRPMAYEFPGEGLEEMKQQFMLGSDLLVAPVIEKNARTKTVYLPKGGWMGWNGQQYAGGTEIRVPVTLQDIPCFQKL